MSRDGGKDRWKSFLVLCVHDVFVIIEVYVVM